ncbi:uncharacterized protein PV06_08531 [Exophiala oligosperma]|uniref:Uncharacterized protein n=1 Tax=Exophiala oligosperma TaxID=215243 RepID=A0A0D2BR85_9EURO|nr:uncharacterized protein PV06_08531 [Exophiala oligosperma]KIW39972.1 hypothetical protein PV06_08531 [Exophiala oligosperma]
MALSYTSSEKNNTMTDTASIQSTSTMSSLKALLPSKRNKKEKAHSPKPKEPTQEEQALKMEARATYMSMIR